MQQKLLIKPSQNPNQIHRKVCLIQETGHLSHYCTLFIKLFGINLPHPLILDFTCFQVFLKLLEITYVVFYRACSQQTTLYLLFALDSLQIYCFMSTNKKTTSKMASKTYNSLYHIQRYD